MHRSNSVKSDLFLICTTVTLIFFGILFIYSSGIDAEGQLINNEYIKQTIWAVLGFILLIFCALIKYQRFCDFSLAIYSLGIFMLIITLLFGSTVNGARSWLGIASVGIQASEFMKIAVIVLLATHLERAKASGKSSMYILISSLLLTALPIFLILLQPDLGTAMVYLPITFAMLFISGVNLSYLFFLIATLGFTGLFVILPIIGSSLNSGSINYQIFFQFNIYYAVILSVLIIVLVLSLLAFLLLKKKPFFYISYLFTTLSISYTLAPFLANLLQDHQISRLLVFLDPYLDPRGAGWHTIQSLTAVGSGGFAGKGFLEGTQSHLQYLPQQSTDFIFSILAEEFGFIGGLFIILLYLVLIVRSIFIASKFGQTAGAYIAIGICTMLAFHFFVSVGMSIGILPVTGIPLLFLSYGGSSLWTAMIGIGLLTSINRSS